MWSTCVAAVVVAVVVVLVVVVMSAGGKTRDSWQLISASSSTSISICI